PCRTPWPNPGHRKTEGANPADLRVLCLRARARTRRGRHSELRGIASSSSICRPTRLLILLVSFRREVGKLRHLKLDALGEVAALHFVRGALVGLKLLDQVGAAMPGRRVGAQL